MASVLPTLTGGAPLLSQSLRVTRGEGEIAAQFGASRNWPFGAALSVMVLVIVMLALVGFAVVARRTSRRGSQQSLESLL